MSTVQMFHLHRDCHWVWLFYEKLIICGPLWTAVDRCGPLWTAVDHCGPLWTAVDRCEPLWTAVDCCGPLWTAVDRRGRLWTTLDHFDLFEASRLCPYWKRVDYGQLSFVLFFFHIFPYVTIYWWFINSCLWYCGKPTKQIISNWAEP